MKIKLKDFTDLFVMEQDFIITDGRKILSAHQMSYELSDIVANMIVDEAYTDGETVIIHASCDKKIAISLR